MGGPMTIREARESDFDALTELWEAAARSTHGFMEDEDFALGGPFIRDHYLPSMEVWLAADDDGPLGFVGARDGHVELLYVDPAAQGRGIGSALLERVDGGRGAHSVQVYADNAAGLAFYRSHGFVERRRFPLDPAGRSYPVVLLER